MGVLDDKVALITGGASGIGAATTKLFVREGAKVLIADILDDNAERLAAELGDDVAYVHTDVTDEAQIETAVRETAARFGRLDCLFNNAGSGGVEGTIEETETTGLDTTISVLLRAVVLGMKHAAPIMKEQGSGSVINTASVAGLQAGFGPHIYSACKAAVVHLSRTVAMELGESGVRVNAICPGGIVTPIFGRSLDLTEQQIEERLSVLDDVLSHAQPIQRSGQPEDIANAALWLASDASSFVNGHALVVDGGLTGGRLWSQYEMMTETIKSMMGAGTGAD